MSASFEARIRDLVARDGRYARDAYCFLFEALEFTYRRLGRRGHVTGVELLEGIREMAIDQFGGLSRLVLEQWGIRATLDFGEIVFSLVESGLMGKTENDSKEDFRDVYDFSDAFPIHAVSKKTRAKNSE